MLGWAVSHDIGQFPIDQTYGQPYPLVAGGPNVMTRANQINGNDRLVMGRV